MPRDATTALVERVRSLILLDAEAVVVRLRRRRREMLELFSRLRDRKPLLAALQSALETAGFTELAALEPEEQQAVAHFAEQLAALRWYAQYTEDMPLAAAKEIDRMVADLEEAQVRLLSVLGRRATTAKVVDLSPKQLPPTKIKPPRKAKRKRPPRSR